MKVVLTVVSIVFVCFLMCGGPARASGPRNLRIVPGGTQYSLENLVLMSGRERDAQIEAIETIHGLNAGEGHLVLLARMAAAENQSALIEALIREWSGLLREPVSSELPEVADLAETSDLSGVEAQLVFLARRTPNGSEAAGQAGALQLKCLTELTEKVVEKDNAGS